MVNGINLKRIIAFILSTTLALLLFACGGGGGGNAPSGEGSSGGNSDINNTYSASGRVTTANYGLSVTLLLTGKSYTSDVSDQNGNFSIVNLTNGDYTLTPSLNGYSFTPEFINFKIDNANKTGLNFTANITSYPSTALITSYMTTLHSQIIDQFLADEHDLSVLLDSQGLYSSGSHYLQSEQDYENHIQSFVNDSLAYIQQTSNSMPIEHNAIIQLFNTFENTDKSYASTYYSSVNWGGSANTISTITNNINVALDAMYSLVIQQIQII